MDGVVELSVVNLYAYRATKPAELWAAEDPVGPENDRYLREACEAADLVICAWGANARADRVRQVFAMLPGNAQCFGHTKSGDPKHPLYLPKDAPLVPLEHLP